MPLRSILLVIAIALPCRADAWIAYGFKSGMSRFDVTERLSERELQVITQGLRQTDAASRAGEQQFRLVYCSTPQLLYLMRYRLPDDPASFAKTLRKLERRYGEPEGLGDSSAYRDSIDQPGAKLTAIWNLNEFETILLIRDQSGMHVEFQDVSVCG